ncbi:TfoX/Sxy family DNA transformation protein [Avibacterium sp. 21-586]|uniref:TfoX/Sxy family DNA transformation protein n=1 Tax=Avibacterium sp. 21-586 TaxID=2911534 RepID=UPI0022455065|nr:TfoX/Sxy family DNA transformation protein [Avibacterium sp. 21-586]MCW9710752.1 TfoX/Sxy family DNA transformation protein [Avibacterium sp. 21-586]
MSITDDATLEIRNELSGLVGEVTAKSLFTGYGIFYRNIMFGLYQNARFYLRAVGSLAEHLIKLGAAPYATDAENPDLRVSQYYRLPNSVISNKIEYRFLVICAIKQVRDKQIEQALLKKNRIKELPNLSVKHEKLLSKINIFDVDTLVRFGADYCYIELRKLGYSVNLSFFWNITAALLNKNVLLLNDTERKAAIIKLNKALKIQGMREISSREVERSIGRLKIR